MNERLILEALAMILERLPWRAPFMAFGEFGKATVPEEQEMVDRLRQAAAE